MLTLTQLSELGKIEELDIYSGISLPEGSPLDRTVLINSIILRCGLNYPLYADPKVMQSAITLWSAKNQYTFDHVGKIYVASYSPIENYDRYEDSSINRQRDLTDNTTGESSKDESIETSSTINANFTDTVTHSGKDSTVTENTTSAFNASTYQPDNKSTSDLTHGEKVVDINYSTSTTTGESTKGTTSGSSTDKTIDEDELTINTSHIHGNIGVMTAQNMIREDYELVKEYNPYDFIAGLFENDLTLCVF